MLSAFHTRWLSALSGLVITCFGATSALADTAVDDIMQQFQAECDAEQAYFLGADDDLDASVQGQLTLAEDAIYEIELTPDGMTGTVVYNEFHCTNIGYAWCGSGGCGFHIIVNGVAYQRRTGFRPISVTADDNTFVLIPIHGSGCITSAGMGGAGVNTCYVVATWDPIAQTFRSKGGEITFDPLGQQTP
jgi:hypothetical protein